MIFLYILGAICIIPIIGISIVVLMILFNGGDISESPNRKANDGEYLHFGIGRVVEIDITQLKNKNIN